MKITIDVTPELISEVARSQELQIENLRRELADARAQLSLFWNRINAAENRAIEAHEDRKAALASLRGAEARRGPDWRAFNAAKAKRTETQSTIAAWADATFGPAVSLASIAERAMKELAELVEKCRALDSACYGSNEIEINPVAEEAADVVIVLARIFESCGVDMHAAIDRKMAINRARRWVLDGDGHGQHVEDEL